MSTRKIREALESYKMLAERQHGGAAPWEAADYDDAIAEVEAIEKAARDLMTPQNPKEKAHALMGRIAKESKE